NSISGSGALVQAGSGTTTLTGTNTYSGGTTVNAGTLQVGSGGTTGSLGNGDVVNDGILNFYRSDDIDIDSIIAGNGTLNQLGSGTLRLNGLNSYTGATTVSAGMLQVNGSIAASSQTDVLSGALIKGNGSIGNLFVQSGASIAPGNSIGTLTINGNFTQQGVYQFEYRAVPLGQSRGRNMLEGSTLAEQDADLIHVTGSGNLAGGSVVLQPLSTTAEFDAALAASPTRAMRYLMLRADGGLGGTQYVALSNGDVRLEYPNATDVELVVRTPVPVLVTGKAPSVLAAADQGLWQAAVLGMARQRPRCDENSGAGEASTRCTFMQGSSWWARQSEPGSLTSDDNHAADGLIGAGFAANDNLWLGVALGGGDANLYDSSAGHADSDTTSGYLWSQWRAGPVDLRGWLGGSYYDISSKRDTLLGAAAKADYHAWQGMAAIEGRYWYALGNNLRASPLASLQATWLNRSSYHEDGGSIESFSADGQQQSSLQSLLGAELAWDSALGDMPLTLEGSLGWQHEFNPTSTTLSGIYAGDYTSTNMQQETADLPPNELRAGLAATLFMGGNGSLRLGYDGGFASDDSSNQQQAITLRYSFAW
ncbi:autotransporter family protein, partial [Pseudomonas sp. N040]|uniref:autotransporter family protein n=1 Tax=Pseudomonas sp. N040 TaxID=2785325 RepID=UPI0018A3184F